MQYIKHILQHRQTEAILVIIPPFFLISVTIINVFIISKGLSVKDKMYNQQHFWLTLTKQPQDIFLLKRNIHQATNLRFYVTDHPQLKYQGTHLDMQVDHILDFCITPFGRLWETRWTSSGLRKKKTIRPDTKSLQTSIGRRTTNVNYMFLFCLIDDQ